MKKFYLLLIFVLSLTLLTSCTKSEKTSVFVKTTESNTKDEIKTQQEINTENIQISEEEAIQEVEIKEEMEEVLPAKEKEETFTGNIVQATTNKKWIASGMTEFNPNQVERSSNIRLAASFINNLILLFLLMCFIF